MALRIDHTWGKPSARQTEQGPNPGYWRTRILYEPERDAHSLEH
jgi:hypothetical protein